MKTQIKERPILFSGEMVRALLDGRKTQTRRIVKFDIPADATEAFAWFGGELRNAPNGCAPDGLWYRTPGGLHHACACPYGKPGDRILISEAVTVKAVSDEAYQVFYHADKSIVERFGTPELIAKIRGYKNPYLRGVALSPAYARDVRPLITEVRVQRLQDISEEDAKAEGVEPGCLTCGENCVNSGGCGYCRPCWRDSFAWLWQSINGPDSWNANPWVWAITFRKV